MLGWSTEQCIDLVTDPENLAVTVAELKEALVSPSFRVPQKGGLCAGSYPPPTGSAVWCGSTTEAHLPTWSFCFGFFFCYGMVGGASGGLRRGGDACPQETSAAPAPTSVSFDVYEQSVQELPALLTAWRTRTQVLPVSPLAVKEALLTRTFQGF